MRRNNSKDKKRRHNSIFDILYVKVKTIETNPEALEQLGECGSADQQLFGADLVQQLLMPFVDDLIKHRDGNFGYFDDPPYSAGFPPLPALRAVPGSVSALSSVLPPSAE